MIVTKENYTTNDNSLDCASERELTYEYGWKYIM